MTIYAYKSRFTGRRGVHSEGVGAMTFSTVPLLIVDPNIPAAARSAMRAARSAANPVLAQWARERAARILADTYELSCAEARELVDLPDDGGARACA